MARIEPLKKEEVEGETKEILEGIEKQFGMVPNLFATIAHYPKALIPLLDFYQAIAKESSIDPGLQEMANVAVSRINKCHYCITHHNELAKMSCVIDPKMSEINREEMTNIFDDKEKAVIEYARQVTKDAHNVSDELFSRLKTHFSEKEIVNLTLIIGLMNVFNRFNGALGVELEK